MSAGATVYEGDRLPPDVAAMLAGAADAERVLWVVEYGDEESGVAKRLAAALCAVGAASWYRASGRSFVLVTTD